ADIDHVLIKPWSLDELRRVVRRAAEFAELAREKAQLALALAAQAEAAAVEQRRRGGALLLGALELRDPEIAGHARRVARLARPLAERLGLGGDELQAIEAGALLHDIGKIGLCDGLLRATAAVTAVEQRQLLAHPLVGAQLIEGTGLLPAT